MPEISNIQTYLKVDQTTYPRAMERFAKVLKAINAWNDEVAESFASFKWEVDVDGSVYSTFTSPRLRSSFSPTSIWPYAFVSLLEDEQVDGHWMVFNLYLETDDLLNMGTGEYFPTTYPLVKSLSLAVHAEFGQTGVYFTDEMQDAAELEVFAHNDHSQLWQFDYAIIPLSLAHLYNHLPATHAINKHESHIEAWNVERWGASA